MNDAAAPHPRDGVEVYADGVIRRIIDACPRRLLGTESERRGHALVEAEFRRLGLPTEYHEMRFNRSLYVVLALHFGLAVAGTAAYFWSPLLACGLHALAATSYFLDSTRRGYWLRRLLPWVPTRNLLAVRKPRGARRLRIVLMGHIDAAYTGTVFHPEILRAGTREPKLRALRFMRKSMFVAVVATGLAAVVDLTAAVFGASGWLLAPLFFFTIPALLTFGFNLEIVLRNQVVPGANDNLTGCVATLVLADRLREWRAEDVELVYVVTGGEEAGAGGAWGLAHAKADLWERADTVIVGLDSLSNGDLRLLHDGEILAEPLAGWLVEVIDGVGRGEARFAEYERYQLPSGATDAMPFLRLGYDAVCLGCVDPEIGAPREYHRPSDTVENLDFEKLVLAIDFSEAVVRAIGEART